LSPTIAEAAFFAVIFVFVIVTLIKALLLVVSYRRSDAGLPPVSA
jgi:hypothetical protein